LLIDGSTGMNDSSPMSNPYLPAIDALRAEIAQKESELTPLRQQLAEKEAEINPLKTTANYLLEKAGMPKEFTLSSTESGGAGSGGKIVIQPSQFFNKEPSEAAVEYLTMKKAATHGDAPTPATVDEIYAALVAGHCKFSGVSDTNNKNALKTALSRNTAQVAKIDDGLYGLRKWYGMRAARKSTEGGGQPESGTNSGAEAPAKPE
jgi:hypothetical protein